MTTEMFLTDRGFPFSSFTYKHLVCVSVIACQSWELRGGSPWDASGWTNKFHNPSNVLKIWGYTMIQIITKMFNYPFICLMRTISRLPENKSALHAQYLLYHSLCLKPLKPTDPIGGPKRLRTCWRWISPVTEVHTWSELDRARGSLEIEPYGWEPCIQFFEEDKKKAEN